MALIIGLLIFITACTTIRPEPCIKNGKSYGITKGLFRGKFWNYYEVALSYTDGACWQKAEQTFKQAIHLKNTDELWTMTYGLRFINYFPHRELGIVYLFQGKFKQAIQELQKSIQQQQSGRSSFYLNVARKYQALQDNTDQLPPQISIQSPGKNHCTNDYVLFITGLARDDTLIEHILINNHPIKTESFASEISFEKRVHIKPGMNTITIKAIDIFGKDFSITQQVFLDIQGPALSIDSVNQNTDFTHIQGNIFDKSGIASVTIQTPTKTIFQKNPDGMKLFHLDCHIPLHGLHETLILQAEDIAGNQTQTPLYFSNSKTDDKQAINCFFENKLLLAANDILMPQIVFSKTNKNDHPFLIEIEGVKDAQAVFFDDIILKVKVSGTNTIKFVSIDHNENRISATSSYTKKHTIGKQFCINLNVQLIEGENRFDIKVGDGSQHDEKTVIIHKKMLEIDDVNMTIAMIPFQGKPFKPDLETLLRGSFNQTRRFNTVAMKSLDEIQKAKDNQKKSLIDCLNDGETQAPLWALEWTVEERDAVIPVKAIEKDANVQLNIKSIGSIAIDQYRENSFMQKIKFLDIKLKLIDTEDNNSVMTTSSFYSENIDIHALYRFVCQALALDITKKIPLAKGIVKSVIKNRLYLNTGKNKGIIKGMRIAIFDTIPVVDDMTGDIIDEYIEMKGEAIIRKVNKKGAFAVVKNKTIIEKLAPHQRFITR